MAAEESSATHFYLAVAWPLFRTSSSDVGLDNPINSKHFEAALISSLPVRSGLQ